LEGLLLVLLELAPTEGGGCGEEELSGGAILLFVLLLTVLLDILLFKTDLLILSRKAVFFHY
jgi:hypothetical protein